MYLDRSTAIQQKQTLTVSNSLIQSLRILQFRHDELNAYIEDQAERNPFIKLKQPMAPAQASDSKVLSQTAVATSDAMGRSSAPSFDQPWKSAPSGAGGAVRSFIDPDQAIEATCSAEITLREHLHRQIGFSFREAPDHAIAVEIVENIDPDGYMRTDLDLLAEMLGTSKEHVEQVLQVVQGFDPAGVGARSLAECLRLQLADRDELSAPMERLLDNLPLLATYDIPKLALVTRTDPNNVIAMVRRIKSLNPKPGNNFDNDPVMPALPDVLIQYGADGGIRVELNSDLLPRVLVDRQYLSQIKRVSTNDEDRRFVADCMTSANFLARSLDQRAKTLLKIATEIASHQAAFLRYGPQHLRPLSMKEVADVTGYHESTVSRATANKFVMTSHGMFELKFLFSNAIAGTRSDVDHSAETVRHQIRNLIDSETAETVLCDNQIVAALKDAGIDVARRTVAKYRDMLRIPSSRQRRRQKRAQMEFQCA